MSAPLLVPPASPVRAPAALARVAALLAVAWLAPGCTSGEVRPARNRDSIVASGVVAPDLLPPAGAPARSGAAATSAWKVVDVPDLDAAADRLAALLKARGTRVVALGDLYTPWWLPELPPAHYAARYILPKLVPALGMRDLVLEYATQDVPDEELVAGVPGGPAPEAPALECALQDWYAADLLPVARRLDLRLHKGGYTPARDRRWTLEDLALRGSPAGAKLRCNPHYVDITAEIKERSLAHILRLRAEGRPALFYGGAEIGEVDDELDLLAECAFENDFRRYTATRAAGAMGADLRALGLGREFAQVIVLSPNHVQHQGRLNEAQYERMWRLKRTTPRLCWRTVGDAIKVVVLLPWAQHRITTMDSKVRVGGDGE